MITALNVANNILSRAFKEKIDVTPMKLQKLIYFVYREYYKKTKKSLFNERFEVWRYGPVLPSVYDEFKECGSNAIREYAYEEDKSILQVKEINGSVFKESIDKIWNMYKEYGGIYLSSLTHKVGSAWREAVNKRENYLSDEDIGKDEVYS